MTNTTRSTIALGFAALIPFAPLAAQTQIAMNDAPAVSAAASKDPGLIATRWEIAEALWAQARFADALKEYEQIAVLQLDSFENPARTYWRIAEAHNALGNRAEMVRALDKVADYSHRFGDNELRGRALLEAAIGYVQLRRHGAANMRGAELQAMIDSGLVSEELRAYIADRVNG